jgi:hypothetical protein
MFLVFGLAGGYYLFTQKMHLNWSAKSALETTGLLDMEHLAKALRNAAGIKNADAKGLTLVNTDGREYNYTLREDKLFRNDFCLTPNGTQVTALAFNYFFKRNAQDMEGMVSNTELDRDNNGRLDALESQSAGMVEVRLAYKSGKQTLTLTQDVVLRNIRME